MEDTGLCIGGSKVTAFSVLLEHSASDDLIGFKQTVEEDGSTINEANFWYGGSSDKKMGFVDAVDDHRALRQHRRRNKRVKRAELELDYV